MTQIDLYNGKGYVRYVDHLGSDLSFVKAARASFAKDPVEWNDKEERLLRFLIKEGHMSCFRHAAVTLQVKAPLLVARQHYKYSVGSSHIDDQNGWNEASRRYITSDNEYYIPTEFQWRDAPADKKQGSGGPVDPRIGAHMTQDLEAYVMMGEQLYNKWLGYDVAPEQCRLFLPAYGLMVNYQLTASVAALMHFFNERLEHDAQLEIQDLARAVYKLVAPLYPATFKAWSELK
jgi:thymidylate synthase (FAD)